MFYSKKNLLLQSDYIIIYIILTLFIWYNYKKRRLYSYEEAKHICEEMGQACAGFVQESNSPSG